MHSPGARRLMLFAIKSVHSIAFLVIASAIVVVLVDGLRGRPRRRTGLSAGIALAECAVFAGNGFVCPLTPVAERYGAERGSVSDIFLPDWLARNLTWISGSMLIAGLVLNGWGILRPARPGAERLAFGMSAGRHGSLATRAIQRLRRSADRMAFQPWSPRGPDRRSER